MTLGSPTPILRIFDEAKALPDFPLSMQASRDPCALHVSEHHGDAIPGSATRVLVESIDAFWTELTSRSYRFLKPSVETAAWGEHQMTLVGPFWVSPEVLRTSGSLVSTTERNPQ